MTYVVERRRAGTKPTCARPDREVVAMDRRIGPLVLALGLAAFGVHGGRAQPPSDEQAIKAANQAFYAAASARDLAQMEAVWAHEPYVRAIHPTNMHVDAGWEAVRLGWQKLFGSFTEIEVSMPEPDLRVGDDLAWVTGAEAFRARRSSGEAVVATLLATSVFERSGDRWLMVHHHVSVAARPPK
jgi:ketosteroid isomerase-like protein